MSDGGVCVPPPQAPCRGGGGRAVGGGARRGAAGGEGVARLDFHAATQHLSQEDRREAEIQVGRVLISHPFPYVTRHVELAALKLYYVVLD